MSQFLKADKMYNTMQLRGTAGQGGPWVSHNNSHLWDFWQIRRELIELLIELKFYVSLYTK